MLFRSGLSTRGTVAQIVANPALNNSLFDGFAMLVYCAMCRAFLGVWLRAATVPKQSTAHRNNQLETLVINHNN